MGRIDAIIEDNAIYDFKIAVIKRLGGKKGSFSKALEEAMKLWSKQDILENLKQKAMDEKTMPSELDQLVKSIKSQGKVGLYTLTELIKKPNLAPSETDTIYYAIQELSKQKESI